MRTRRLAILLGVVLGAAALACTSAEERVARHLERARVYGEQGQPQKALIELQSALKLEPKNFEINLLAAQMLIESERMEDALFYFEEALRLDPKNDEAALGVAQLLLFSEVDRADGLVEEVLARSPGNRTAHVMRSDVFLIRQDLNAALASALTAVELDPEDPRSALQVAVVRKAFVAEKTQTKQPVGPELLAEADAAFAHASQLAENKQIPEWIVRAALERAQLMALQEGQSAAIGELLLTTYEKVKGSPRDARQLLAATRTFATASKNLELERSALARTVELQPNRYQMWERLADVTAELGEDPFAVMERLVKEQAAAPRAHTTYAEYLSRHGKNKDATAYLERVVSDSTEPDRLLAASTTLYLMGGDADAATRTLERLRKEHPDSSQTAFAEVTLANAEGRYRDAIAVLERWTDREESPQALGLLAGALLRTGNPRDALDAIDRAIAASQRPRRDFQRVRGRILVALGDHQAAVQAFAATREPGKPLPLDYVPDLARALYALDRDDSARKVLQRALDTERPAPQALLLVASQEAERDPIAARTALERGHSLYPTMPMFIELLVSSELRANQPDHALARAQSAVERLPDSSRLQMTLARTLVAAGRMDDAVKQVEVVRERWPGQVGVAELYLDVMMRAGRGDQAFQVLSQQHAAGNLPPQGRVVLARLHVSRGEDTKAIELLRSALADQPGVPSAQNDLAYLLARRGEDLPEATELAQEARANRPDSSEIADTLGYVYLRRELDYAALVQFDAAVELAEPESTVWATAQFHRGLALKNLGRQADAIAAIEQALASGAEFGQAQEAHRVLAELASAQPAGPGS